MTDTDFRWATVTAVGPLRVQLDGDTAPLPITPDSLLDPLTLAVSDRVRCELTLNRVIVHGRWNGSSVYSQAQVNGLLTHRNQIINAAMNVWQRGTSFVNPATLAYTADRWQVVFDGTGATRTISQQSFTAGSEVCGAPFFLRFAQTVAGSGATVTSLIQRIEEVRTNANGTITLSFWAQLAAAASIAVRVGQNFGAAGSATAVTASQNVAVTTSWQRYSATFTPPSIVGKTVGAGNHFFIEFVLPLNATFTIDFTGIQVEAGAVTTPFERTPVVDDILRCERYYRRSPAATLFGPAAASNTNQPSLQWELDPPMRVAPTITFVGQITLTDYFSVNLSATSPAVSTMLSTPTGGFMIFAAAFSGVVAQRLYGIDPRGTGYAELVAEL